MTQKQAIQLFEERRVRTLWDDEQEKCYFSIVDVVVVLTDVADQEQLFHLIQSVASPKANPLPPITNTMSKFITSATANITSRATNLGASLSISNTPAHGKKIC